MQAQAEKWAKTAAEKGGKPELYLSWAAVLKHMGNKDKAKTVAEKAKGMVGEDAALKSKIEVFIQTLGA